MVTPDNQPEEKYEFSHNIFPDGSLFFPTKSGEKDAVMLLLKWVERGVVTPIIAHSVQREIEHSNTPAEIKSIVEGYVYTKDIGFTLDQMARLKQVEDIIVGNGKRENFSNDALHIFIAEDSGEYFLTLDERLIKKREEIKKCINIKICKPSEFVAIVKKDEMGWRERIARHARG